MVLNFTNTLSLCKIVSCFRNNYLNFPDVYLSKWGWIATQRQGIWRIWVIRYVAFDLETHNLHGPSTEVDKKSSAPKKSCDRADIKILNNLCFSNRNSFVFPTETPFMRNLRSRQIRELRISYELENTFASSLFLWFGVNPTFLFPFL